MAVRLEYETVAHCSAERVWETFRDVSAWKRWNPSIGNVRWVSGEPWQIGSRLVMELVQPRPMALESEVVENAAPGLLRIKGKVMGVNAEHSFAFEAQPDGTTKMRTWQVLSGPATIFLSEKLKKMATDTFAKWFEAARQEAETTPPAPPLSTSL